MGDSTSSSSKLIYDVSPPKHSLSFLNTKLTLGARTTPKTIRRNCAARVCVPRRESDFAYCVCTHTGVLMQSRSLCRREVQRQGNTDLLLENTAVVVVRLAPALDALL
jgi:DNA repair ATPase RecN